MHTDECIRQRRIAISMREAHLEVWPETCKSCEGYGGGTVYDSVDYGSSRTNMPSFEECEDCIGAGLCPRCAKPVGELPDSIDDWECPHCRWTAGRSPEDTMPQVPECFGECMGDALEV